MPRHSFWLGAPRQSGEFELSLFDGEYSIKVADAPVVVAGEGAGDVVAISTAYLEADSPLRRSVHLGQICVGP